MKRYLLAAGLALTVGLTGCAADETSNAATPDEAATPDAPATSEETSTSEESTPQEADSAEGESVEITAVDYGFDGVPEMVPAGTELTLTNASAEEFHEMVVFRVDDDQDMSMDEIAEMAAQESDGPPPEWLTFSGVALAMPSEDGFTPEGPVVLDEPGRYLLLCFIPTGADPAALEESMESGEEPPMNGGPPHVAEGMVAELTVE